MISRNRLVLYLGIAMIALSLIAKYITVSYWIESGWDSSSYHWSSPIISLLGTLCYLGVLLYDRISWRRQKALWALGYVSLAFDILFFWMVDLR